MFATGVTMGLAEWIIVVIISRCDCVSTYQIRCLNWSFLSYKSDSQDFMNMNDISHKPLYSNYMEKIIKSEMLSILWNVLTKISRFRFSCNFNESFFAASFQEKKTRKDFLRIEWIKMLFLRPSIKLKQNQRKINLHYWHFNFGFRMKPSYNFIRFFRIFKENQIKERISITIKLYLSSVIEMINLIILKRILPWNYRHFQCLSIFILSHYFWMDFGLRNLYSLTEFILSWLDHIE